MVKDPDHRVFDFVLHDGSQEFAKVVTDIQHILPRMKMKALLLVHDAAHPTKEYNLDKAANEALSGYKYSKVTLPCGYGLDIIRIEEDFGKGEVHTKWKTQP